MRYQVMITASITPMLEGDSGAFASSNSLYFHRTFNLEGDRFSDIATRVDALVDAVENAVKIGAQQ